MALPIVYLLTNGMLQSSPFNLRSLVRKIPYGARSQNQATQCEWSCYTFHEKRKAKRERVLIYLFRFIQYGKIFYFKINLINRRLINYLTLILHLLPLNIIR